VVFCGSHLAEGHGNKAVVKAVGVSPLVRVVCLASLSALWFSQAIVESPFLCHWQCVTDPHLGAHSILRIFLSILDIFSSLVNESPFFI
jgi:hypothetical protein